MTTNSLKKPCDDIWLKILWKVLLLMIFDNKSFWKFCWWYLTKRNVRSFFWWYLTACCHIRRQWICCTALTANQHRHICINIYIYINHFWIWYKIQPTHYKTILDQYWGLSFRFWRKSNLGPGSSPNVKHHSEWESREE